MNKHTVAVGLVVLPLPLIVISICMREFALSLRFVVPPLTLIHRSIWPLLPAVPVSHVAQPLPFILYSIFESLQRFFLSFDASYGFSFFGEGRIDWVGLKCIVIGVHFGSFVVLVEDEDIMFLFREVFVVGFQFNWIQLLSVDQLVLLLLAELHSERLRDVVAEVPAFTVPHRNYLLYS